MMRYYLTPRIYDTEVGWWPPPPNAIGAIDLRSLTQCGPPGAAPLGYDFASFEDTITISGAIYLGDSLGALRNKSAMETALGLGVGEILATNVRDALWEYLNQHADPAGLARCGPLVPTMRGDVEMHLGGLLRSERFDQTIHPLVIQVEQNSYRHVREDAIAGFLRGVDGKVDIQFHRRYLDGLVAKYRLPYQTFIPSDLPDEKPLPRGTTVTDDFNRSDEDLSASANWDELAGDMDVVSNQVSMTGTAAQNMARHATALSSNDNYGQLEIITLNQPAASSNRVGPTFRSQAAANTSYSAEPSRSSADAQTIQFLKVVTGSISGIGAAPSITLSLPDTAKGQADGTTMTSFFNGSQEEQFTDPAITTGLHGGLGSRVRDSAGDCVGDDGEWADLAAVAAKRRRVGFGAGYAMRM